MKILPRYKNSILDGIKVCIDWEDVETREAIKRLPGHRWNKTDKCWDFPLDPVILGAIKEIAEFEVHPDLLKYLDGLRPIWKRMKELQHLDTEPADEFKVEGLYPFQKIGVEFMAVCPNPLLADDMGMGKTVQTIVALRERSRILVVAPNSVLDAWAETFETWAPEFTCWELWGTKGNRDHIVEMMFNHETDDIEKMALIINWEKAAITPELQKHTWSAVVADEAHKLKNPHSKQTGAVKSIPAKKRVALTGTPIVNTPSDLWSIINWLEPKRYPHYWKFMDQFIDYRRGYFGGIEVAGLKRGVEARFGAEMDGLYIRRTRDEVGIDRPVVDQKLKVHLPPEQLKAYKQMEEEELLALFSEHGEVEDYLTAPSTLAVILRLQQIADSLGILDENRPVSGKLDALVELLSDHPNEKFVVFTKFRKFADIVGDRLRNEGIGFVPYTGTVSRQDRRESVRIFHEDPGCQVFLATTQTASLGLSIKATSNVIFLDQLWSPAQQRQAESRVQGIGRGDESATTNIWTLIAADTIDQHIANVLHAKETMARSVLAREVIGSYGLKVKQWDSGEEIEFEPEDGMDEIGELVS